MPIINGSYQYSPLTDAKSAQNQVFGEYTRKDMSDYSQAAYNYLMQQQQQAYELDLWNLKNAYDSPASQMKRYLDAGLNPNLIYGQQNTSGNVPTGAPAQFRSSGTYQKGVQNAMNLIGQVMNIVKTARDTYDYMIYGKTERSFQTSLLGQQLSAQQMANDWNAYLTYGPSFHESYDPKQVQSSPRSQMYNLQANTQEQNYYRLRALVDLIPEQKARTEALKALDVKRMEILKGQNDAVLNIHTGNATVDSWLKAIMFFAMSKL